MAENENDPTSSHEREKNDFAEGQENEKDETQGGFAKGQEKDPDNPENKKVGDFAEGQEHEHHHHEGNFAEGQERRRQVVTASPGGGRPSPAPS